jgi:hypothetical protein
LNNKKGTIDDKIYFIFIFTFIVVLLGAVFLMYTPIYDTLSGLGTAPATAMANIVPASVFGWVDWIAVFLYFAFNILICIILPMYVPHNPIYIAALFIFSFIYAFVVAIIANALVEFLYSIGSTYTHLQYILNNLVVFEVVFVLILAIIMFYKYRTAQSTGIYYG